MKTKLLFSFIFLSAIVNAQTIVGGAISSNTTWNIAGSPYLVQSNVAVMTGVTLTIDAGVVVKFSSQTSIQFFGTLRAIGTQSQPITFTSVAAIPNPGDWGYILFNNSSPAYNFSNGTGSIMQYCIVEFGGGATVNYNGIMRLNNSFPYLNNCTIQNNSKPAIKAWNLSSTLFVDSCIIQHNNVDTGTVYASSGTLYLRGCSISNNNTSLSTSDDYSVAGVYTIETAMRIQNCTFNANNSRAICGYKSGSNFQIDTLSYNNITNNLMSGIYYLTYLSNGDVANKTFCILNNVISGNSENGIYFFYENIHRCDSYTYIITNNSINNNVGNGIYFNNGNRPIGTNTYTIANNSINNNTGHGIYYYGAYIDNNSYVFNNNTINNNTGDGIYYHIYNDGDLFVSNTYSITNNIISKNIACGINFSLNPGFDISSPNSLLFQKNKLISNNGTQGGGIIIQSNYNCTIALTMEHNIIAGNNTSTQGGGFYMDFRDINNVVSNNTIIYNSGLTSSGIYYKGQGILQANKNTIVFNKITGTDSLRMVYLKQTQSFNNNNIYNSTCFSPIVLWYDDYNGNTLNAQFCYWKKVTSTAIDTVVWDYFDDQNLAIVDHSNFESLPDTAAPVTPVENIVKTNLGGGKIQLNWAPNLETDLAGYKVYWGSPTGYSFTNMANVGNVTSYTVSPANMSDTIAVTAYDTQANGTDDQVNGHESWFSTGDSCSASPLGITPLHTEISISVFPNPTNGIFTIQSTEKINSIEIYNLLGEKIYSTSINSDKAVIDLSSHPQGVYFLQAKTEKGMIAKKVVLSR